MSVFWIRKGAKVLSGERKCSEICSRKYSRKVEKHDKWMGDKPTKCIFYFKFEFKSTIIKDFTIFNISHIISHHATQYIFL